MNVDTAALITTTTEVKLPAVVPAPESPAATGNVAQAPRAARPARVQKERKPWRGVGAATPVLAAEVGSRFLYVAEQGALIRKVGSRIRVTKRNADLLHVSALKLQAVVLYGNIQISTQCMRTLLDDGVSVALFSRNGTYRGRLQGPADAGAALRRRQWERSGNAAFCLEFARAVVRGKLLGASRVASAYAKNYLAGSLGTAHGILRDTLGRLDDVGDIETLRGVEGAAARAWFDLFRRCNRSSLPFDGRKKRPAGDPINALLSFGYMMLMGELEGLLYGAGLDPSIGFYHGSHGNRPALACDWVEEFRHAIVDRLVLGLVNRESIRVEHFQEPGDRGVRLTTDGLRVFVTAYERVLLGEDGPQGGWRVVFLQQLGRLIDAIAGRAPYRSHAETDEQPSSVLLPATLADLAGRTAADSAEDSQAVCAADASG